MTNPQPENTAAPAAATPPPNPLLRQADFSFPVEEIDKKIDATLGKQQKKIAMPGFRRGKVPLSVLRRHYGRATLHEVLQQECAPKFQQELEEKKERAAAQPQLHLPDVAKEGVYTVHCHYEVIPEVPPPDLSGKTLKKPTFTVDDAAVDEMIEVLRTQRGTYTAVDGAAGDEDHRLRVDFQSILLPAAGEEAKDEDNVIESGNDRPLLLSDKTLRPELRQALVGVCAGETRNVEMVMPEGSTNEKLRGRTVRMQISVNAVEKLHKAELNEAFFTVFGEETKTMEAFRELVRHHLQRESKVRLRNLLHTHAMNVLISATAPFPLPQSMLATECHRLLQEAQAQWKQRGMAETAAQLSLPMFLPEAKRRVALGLILSSWQKREKPEIGKDDIETRLQEIADAYEDPETAATQLRNNANEMEAIYLSVLEDRVTDWVCANCTSEEMALTFADFLNDGRQAA